MLRRTKKELITVFKIKNWLKLYVNNMFSGEYYVLIYITQNHLNKLDMDFVISI